jgi:cysteine synthase A
VIYIIHTSIETLIGLTPLVALKKYAAYYNLPVRLFGKLEAANPGGSVKDRLALALLDDAEKRGVLNADTLIIEPTSGNTGVGLAMLAAARGYRLLLVMPDTMSTERRMLCKAYGAELVLSEGTLGMGGAVAKAKELAESTPNSFLPGQFDNPANPAMHYGTTGPEIWRDCGGKIDILVAGVGTGGTISGAGKYLREKNPEIEIVAVEPAASAVLSGGNAGAHKIQGIGAGFVPETYAASVCDEIIGVTEEAARETCAQLARHEGLLLGISSGAALYAARSVAERYEGKQKPRSQPENDYPLTLVVILPDSGERYLSTDLFNA